VHIGFEMRVLIERSEARKESAESLVAYNSRSSSYNQIRRLSGLVSSNVDVEGAMKEWVGDVEDRFSRRNNKKREFFSRLPCRGSFEERRRAVTET